MKRRVASLFAGAGGFELGLSQAGCEAAFLCEIDPAARAVLAHRFRQVPLVGDIRTLDALPEDLDVLTAGFPCQDLSSVGQKEGISGLKSSLVGDVFRLLERRPVEWVIVENVYFMLHLKGGSGVRTVAEGFESLGYKWAYRTLDSASFGLPQRRRRVFFVASREHDPRGALLAPEAAPIENRPHISRPIGFYWTEGRHATGITCSGIPTLKGGSSLGIPSAPAIHLPGGQVGMPALQDAERLQGFPSGWTEAADKVAKGARWKLLGNAVSVPVARWIGERLDSRDVYDDSWDFPLVEGKWPNAAWNVGQGRHESRASEYVGGTTSIADFLEHDLKPLSKKAVDGFVSRIKESGLKSPSGFVESLEGYSARYAA